MPNVLSSAGRAYGGPGGSPHADAANYTTSAPGGGRDILARLLAGAGAAPPPIPQELLNPAAPQQPPPIPPELLNPAQPPPIPAEMLTADFPNGVPAAGTPFPAAPAAAPAPAPAMAAAAPPPVAAATAPPPPSPPAPPLAKAAGTPTAPYEPRGYQKKKKKGQYSLRIEQGD